LPTRRERLLLLAPLAVILLPFLIWPAVFGLLASLTNYAPGELHLRFVGLANYAAAISDDSFRSSWRNIAIFLLVSVPAELVLGLGIAYLLREPFRGRALVRVVLLIPWLVSPLANGVLWHFLLNLQTGLINFGLSWLGVSTLPSPLGSTALALPTTIATDIWRKVPLASFLLLPGLLAIPSEQWEYATMEGASVLSRIRHIALPWLRSLLLTVGLLLVGDALGTSDSLLILTGGGPGSATFMPALYSYQQAFQFNLWTVGATSAWFIVAGVLLVGLVYLRLVRTRAE
jgi:multiple sugar transport system permease protein